MAFDDDFENEQEQNGPKQLRDALDKANKALADRDKKLNDALERIAAFERKERASSLSDLLKAKNVDPKYARWADKDGVEPTEDAVAKWLDENKDLVPVSAPSTEDSRQNDPAAPQGAQVDPYAGLPAEVRAALEAMSASQAMESNATAGSPVDPKAEEGIAASLAAVGQNAKSEGDIIAALAALGAPLVPTATTR